VATIHLAGSVACFVIGGLLAVMGGFITFWCRVGLVATSTYSPFLECMGSWYGVVFVTGICILCIGVIIAVSAKN